MARSTPPPRLPPAPAGGRSLQGGGGSARPRLAVWKFASCDGCQLSLLDCEDELLAVADAIEIANFPEASSNIQPGPYDLSLVEGSITTPEDLERIQDIRRQSKTLITIGACATAGGIQALRNFADVREFVAAVYARPDYIHTLDKTTPIAAHVRVDYELRGCPINKRQLLEVVTAFLHRRAPAISAEPVCVACKRAGNPCVIVAHGTPCLGPVTHTGCEALCPSYNRGCFGCYGPSEAPNPPAMSAVWERLGSPADATLRAWRGTNAAASAFAAEAERLLQRNNNPESLPHRNKEGA